MAAIMFYITVEAPVSILDDVIARHHIFPYNMFCLTPFTIVRASKTDIVFSGFGKLFCAVWANHENTVNVISLLSTLSSQSRH